MWRSRGGGGQGGPFPQKYLNSQRKLSVKENMHMSTKNVE